MARGLPNWRMSAPAMKLRPAPIITIALTDGSASPFSSASTMPSRTPGPSALTGGLSMVTMPIPSSTSKRTSGLSLIVAFPSLSIVSATVGASLRDPRHRGHDLSSNGARSWRRQQALLLKDAEAFDEHGFGIHHLVEAGLHQLDGRGE